MRKANTIMSLVSAAMLLPAVACPKQIDEPDQPDIIGGQSGTQAPDFTKSTLCYFMKNGLYSVVLNGYQIDPNDFSEIAMDEPSLREQLRTQGPGPNPPKTAKAGNHSSSALNIPPCP